NDPLQKPRTRADRNPLQKPCRVFNFRSIQNVCSDINKPNGQFLLPNDRTAIMTFISPLPIRKVCLLKADIIHYVSVRKARLGFCVSSVMSTQFLATVELMLGILAQSFIFILYQARDLKVSLL
ncbi:hypothetical protein M8C21_011438, partial [Ambrosia artemisiifolia]